MANFKNLPTKARFDAPLWGQLGGLPNNQAVDISVQLRTASGDVWQAQATFLSSDDTFIDLAGGPPSGADWIGSDAYGLYWSMLRKTPQNDWGSSFEGVTASLEPLTTEVTAYIGQDVIATGNFERQFLFRAEKEEWRDDIIANLFLPAFQEASGAVLVIGGSEGGFAWSNQVAALIAASGSAALAVAYFDWQGVYSLPTSLSEIPLEVFTEALDRMKQDARIKGDLAIVGFSKGSEAALWLASKRSDIRKVVAYSPSAYLWESARMNPNEPVRSSWTWQGDALPFVEVAADESFYRSFDKTALGPFHERALGETADGDLEAARIRVEDINADILLLSGTEDSIWPSSNMSKTITSRLKTQGKEAKHLSFDGAGHSFSVPGTPATKLDGKPAANAYADRKSWGALRARLGLA